MAASSSSRRWLVLTAMAGSASMVMLDQRVVSVALPTMGRELPLTSTGQQWVVNASALAIAALVALGGRLGDCFGGVKVFRAGVYVYFLASAACAVAPPGAWGEPWIITTRTVQGVGAALMIPVSASIVANTFPAAERGRAMALYAGVSEVFLGLGPLIGGALTEAVSWRAVFWLNVPLGIASVVLVGLARPQDHRILGTRVPVVPALRLVGGVALLVLGIMQTSQWGLLAAAGTMAAGAALAAWFVVCELRADDPLVDLRLLARGPFLGNVVVLGLYQFGVLAVMLFGSLYLQDILELSPLTAGVGVLPVVLPLMAAAQWGGAWYDRAGVRRPVLTGLAIGAAGLGLWAASLPYLSYWMLVPGMVVTGIGLGLAATPSYTDALGRVRARQRGQASGLIQTIRQLGGTFGVAVIGAVVLGVEHEGTRAPDRGHAAFATLLGYGCGALVFAVALLAGVLLLPRSRVVDDPDDPAAHRENQARDAGPSNRLHRSSARGKVTPVSTDSKENL